MSPIVEELRNAAKCAPLWKTIFEAAADEIERLQGENKRMKNEYRGQLVSINKIKADIVQKALLSTTPNSEHVRGR